MGLDQYLYVAKEELEQDYYEHLGEKICEETSEIYYYDETEILEPIAYFRKSNWLHGYLNKLCLERTYHEIEDCEYFIFSQQDLKNLLALCREVVEYKSIAYAEDWLPPMSGFFFGSTAIDEYYFEDVQDFINDMEVYEEDNFQYVYYAWW